MYRIVIHGVPTRSEARIMAASYGRMTVDTTAGAGNVVTVTIEADDEATADILPFPEPVSLRKDTPAIG